MNWDRLKKLSWIPATIVACWLIWDRIDVPDSIEPATVQYVDDSISPIQQTANNADYDRAVKGISWALGQGPDSRFTPEYIHEQLCGNSSLKVEGYYRTYLRVTGTKHPTEGDRCN